MMMPRKDEEEENEEINRGKESLDTPSLPKRTREGASEPQHNAEMESPVIIERPSTPPSSAGGWLADKQQAGIEQKRQGGGGGGDNNNNNNNNTTCCQQAWKPCPSPCQFGDVKRTSSLRY